jgi:hypothetical protein
LWLLASSQALAWNNWATVWPCEEYYRLTSPVLVTGLVARQWTAVFRQWTADGTSSIPAIGYGSGGEPGEFAGPTILGTPASERSWTNTWYSDIARSSDHYAVTNLYPEWGYPSWAGWLTPSNLVSTNVNAVGGVTVLTERVASSIGVQWEGKMDAVDLVALEAFGCAAERSLASGGTVSSGPFFYKDHEDTLASVRYALIALSYGFYDLAVIDEPTHETWPTNDRLSWAFVTNALPQVPPNWSSDWSSTNDTYLLPPAYVGRAMMGNGPEAAIGQTLEQTWTISGPTNGTVVTNTVRLWNYALFDTYWGSGYEGLPAITAEISGTNGQQVTTVCTNWASFSELSGGTTNHYLVGILPGYTLGDYGFKHVRAVAELLRCTLATPSWADGTLYAGYTSVINWGCFFGTNWGDYPDWPANWAGLPPGPVDPTCTATSFNPVADAWVQTYAQLDESYGYGYNWQFPEHACPDFNYVLWARSDSEQRYGDYVMRATVPLTLGPTVHWYIYPVAHWGDYFSPSDLPETNWTQGATFDIPSGTNAATVDVSWFGEIAVSTNSPRGSRCGGKKAFADWSEAFDYP